MNLLLATNLKFLDSLDLELFFKNHKVILVLPTISLMPNTINFLNIHSFQEDSLMILSPYSLAILAKQRKWLLSGPGNLEDIVSYVKLYYQKKYQIEKIKINQSYTKEWEKNYILTFKKTLSSFQEKIHNVNKEKQRKILFVQGNGTVYSKNPYLFESNKNFLKEYLGQGNFLAMFEPTGIHLDRPFRTDCYIESNSLRNKKMIDFYTSLKIEALQVMDFKTTHVGISFDGSTCNLGWTSGQESNLIHLYLDYLKEQGFFIKELYAYDFFAHYPLLNAIRFLGGVTEKAVYKEVDIAFQDENTSLSKFGYDKVLKRK